MNLYTYIFINDMHHMHILPYIKQKKETTGANSCKHCLFSLYPPSSTIVRSSVQP